MLLERVIDLQLPAGPEIKFWSIKAMFNKIYYRWEKTNMTTSIDSKTLYVIRYMENIWNWKQKKQKKENHENFDYILYIYSYVFFSLIDRHTAKIFTE